MYVDETGKPGDFFLTGSATPNEEISLHSGAGRFSQLELLTLTTFEIFRNENAISLKDFFCDNCTFKFNENK
jgi:hypothetical protein